MEIAPGTVSPGDRLQTVLTISDDGFTATELDCQLLLSEGSPELDKELEAGDRVSVEFTVDSCRWATGPQGDHMFFVTIEQQNRISAAEESEQDDGGGNVDEETEEAGSEGDEGQAQERRETVSEIDWDPNQPLDKTVLRRLLNGGQRVPTSDENIRHDQSERTAIEFADKLIRLADALSVSPAVCYQAAELYGEALGRDMIREKKKDVALAATFRLATLVQDEHRPIVAIEREFEELEANWIADKERQLIQTLDVDPSVVLIPPQKYLPYLLSKLDIDPEVPIARDANTLAREASFGGRNPWVIAAAAVYAAGIRDGNQKLNQKHIADIADTSTVSIRNIYRELLDDSSFQD
mgnify:CR=1 FL=1